MNDDDYDTEAVKLWIVILLACLVVIFSAMKVSAHTQWANGDPIPKWVQSQCCGVSDAHRLDPAQVHQEADGYHIDGYDKVVPYKDALPSQDGAYWAFYSEGLSGGVKYQGHMYCFFVPMGF